MEIMKLIDRLFYFL